MIIAIIPARAGSKGLPGKNKRFLSGLSLTAWAIRAGLRAKFVDQVILSTEDEDIAKIGHAEGASVRQRPIELATDDATTLSVINDIYSQFVGNESFCDGIVLLEPTSPFRTPELVDICIQRYLSSQCRTVVTVSELERHPANILHVREDKSAAPFIREPKTEFRRRQDFEHLKQITGAVYVVNPRNIADGKVIVPPIMTVNMSSSISVNIDTIFDFHVAEMALELSSNRGENYSSILDS